MAFLTALLPEFLGGAAAGTGLATAAGGATVGGVLGAAPVAAAASGIPWGAVFTGLGAGSQLLQGLAGYRSAQTNAAYMDAAAKQALQAGAANEDIAAARGRAEVGALRATVGAQGTTMAGSPMLVYLDSVKNAALTSAQQYYEGQLKSYSLTQQAKATRQGGLFDLLGGGVRAIGGLGSALLA